MTGIEALNKINNVLYSVYAQEQYSKELALIEKSLKALEIIKPLFEVVETPVKKYRYLKVYGVVVYTFKNEEEFDLLKEVLK